MRDTSQLSMVFVGCGGTFFMGMSYFKVLVRRYKPRQLLFVDPDRLVGKNQDRQWPCKSNRGQYKAVIAGEEFGPDRDPDVATDVMSFGELVELEKKNQLLSEGCDVLVVVNVDNDAARLEVREWARSRKGWTGMVVSGCEADYGQAYWGAWEDGATIHNWLALHRDVGRGEGTEHRCTPQTAESNALTGTLTGLALADVLTVYRMKEVGGVLPTMVREYYWSVDALKRVKSWTLEVVRQGGEG